MNPINYKETLNLPKTDFAMKANLPQREPEILAAWTSKGIYAKLRAQMKGKPTFVLHDGPPFANGDIHLGHVLNKTLKDIIVRYMTMTGHDSPYVPGWDCHGLPIEHQVAGHLKDQRPEPVRVRRECAAFAQKFIDTQREQFKRLGIWGEWDTPYVTMSPAYEADILRVFADLVEKGLVYEGLKPVYWSTGCRTALAEAEVEYEDREDPSVYVKFEVSAASGTKTDLGRWLGANLVIWTTTPWTLPANLAAAVHPDYEYVLASNGAEKLILAEGRLDDFSKIAGRNFKVEQKIKGREMDGMFQYRHPFLNRKGLVYAAEFVTLDAGTGIVHIAPGHGHDDYALGQKHGLQPLSPVDDAGKLTAESGVPELTGMYVFDANAKVIEILKSKGALLAEEKYRHSYPHCWRSKTPIVFRSVKQWFIRVESFRKKAMENIDKVQWLPDWGKNRIVGSVGSRADWCISRQRTWGVPIPVWYKPNGDAVLDPKVIRAFADLAEKSGTDLWYVESDADLAAKLGLPGDLKKGADTLDVWIDSGSSFRAVSKRRLKYPADLYLEGSDQHRGWFQSSLLLATATDGTPPYKSVLTHGFVVDGQGRKMSKSLGNVIKPLDVLKEYGADILRLWVVSGDYADDVRVSKDIFSRVADTYRKYRNTLRYILGNLNGFTPDKDWLPDAQLLEADRWALSRASEFVRAATESYDKKQFHLFYQALHLFLTRDMSSVYLDLLKDRLYTDALSSTSGRSARTASFRILRSLLAVTAPILPFTSDEAWGYVPEFKGKPESVHLVQWLDDIQLKGLADKALDEKWERLLTFRDEALKRLEEKREAKLIGSALEAAVTFTHAEAGAADFLAKNAGVMEELLVVSAVKSTQDHQAGISVDRASGKKCARCWKYRGEVGNDARHPELCARCLAVVTA